VEQYIFCTALSGRRKVIVPAAVQRHAISKRQREAAAESNNIFFNVIIIE
jgi:hypothetical protein